MRIVHISDTHGYKTHEKLTIPECDVLIHSGDIGGRTTIQELIVFLDWFNKQPARKKIWVAGNHDLTLDKKWLNDRAGNTVSDMISRQLYTEVKALTEKYPNVKYLENTDYVYEGVKFWGSPITPSFHRAHWAFNADRGEEIRKYWARIPKDVEVLITHGPPHGMLDLIPESFKSTPDEDVHRGCEDLMEMIQKKLTKLKLHCFGHIHEGPAGLINAAVSNTRHVLFSNGAVLSNQYQLITEKPLIITI